VSAILYLAFIGTADTIHEADICLAIAGGWALVTVLYVLIGNRREGRTLLHQPTV
jgi:hypothetical protein